MDLNAWHFALAGLVLVIGGLAASKSLLRRLAQKEFSPTETAEIVRYATDFFGEGAVLFISTRRGPAKWPFIQLQVRGSGEARHYVVGLPRLPEDQGEFEIIDTHLRRIGAFRRVQPGAGRVREFIEFDLGSSPHEVSRHISGLVNAVPALCKGPLYALQEGPFLSERYRDHQKTLLQDRDGASDSN